VNFMLFFAATEVSHCFPDKKIPIIIY
jgi:hypothetical protein